MGFFEELRGEVEKLARELDAYRAYMQGFVGGTLDAASVGGVLDPARVGGLGMADPTTTKGDLIARGASAPATRLGVGSNGQALLADSAQALGVRWGTVSAVAALDDLSDVTLTSPAATERLRFDGSVWRNSALAWVPLSNGDPSDPQLVFDALGQVVMVEA